MDAPQSDTIHMGHKILQSLKQVPDAICQIDAATGEEETNASVLSRTIRLGNYLRSQGLQIGDVLALGGFNHLDLHIPHYAGLMNGYAVVGVDPLFKLDEIKSVFKLAQPKIAFCQPEQYQVYVEAATWLGIDTRVIPFGKGENSMSRIIDDQKEESLNDFAPATFDPSNVIAWLVSTGGTSGALKLATVTHKGWIDSIVSSWSIFQNTFSALDGVQKNKLELFASPVQWISSFYLTISILMRKKIKLQTSAPATADHIIDVINKYKPAVGSVTPALLSSIVTSEKPCDLSCFNIIYVVGGKVYVDIMREAKKRVREDTIIIEAYGQTENLTPILALNPSGPEGSCGKPVPLIPVKLVDPETGKDITEPYVTGELWNKNWGFKGYYNNPEATAAALTEDGWYRTGDLLYRDEDDNYFFVERLKMLIKYRNYHIIPMELEDVIRAHPAVLDVSVTSIPHNEDGEHPVAAVVVKPGADLTARDVKDLVASKLSNAKHLRGGVVFMDQLPMTSIGKVARGKLRQIVRDATRE